MSDEKKFKVYYMHNARKSLKFPIVHNGQRAMIELANGSVLVEDADLDADIQKTLKSRPIAGLRRVDFNEASAKQAALMDAENAKGPSAANGMFNSQTATEMQSIHRNASLEHMLASKEGEAKVDEVTNGNLKGTVPAGITLNKNS
jgi:hypothetical protein